MFSKIRGRSKSKSDANSDESAIGEVFGKDLRQRIESERKIYQDPSIMIPTIVKFLIDFIQNAPPRQGIFREVGSVLNVSNYRSKANEYGQKPVDYRSLFKHSLTPNDASSLLKSYFRYLPEPLVTFNGYDRLVVIGQTELDEKIRISKLKTMVEGLPTVNYETLKYLMNMLYEISIKSIYCMDSNNLAVCLNPSICFAKNKDQVSPSLSSLDNSFSNLNYIITSLSSMIRNYQLVFDQQNVVSDLKLSPPPSSGTTVIQSGSSSSVSAEPKVIIERKESPPPEMIQLPPPTTTTTTTRSPSKSISVQTTTSSTPTPQRLASTIVVSRSSTTNSPTTTATNKHERVTSPTTTTTTKYTPPISIGNHSHRNSTTIEDDDDDDYSIDFDPEFQETILKELDRLDSKFDFKYTTTNDNNDNNYNEFGELIPTPTSATTTTNNSELTPASYGKFLNTNEMFNEIDHAESSETLDDDNSNNRRRSLSSIVFPPPPTSLPTPDSPSIVISPPSFKTKQSNIISETTNDNKNDNKNVNSNGNNSVVDMNKVMEMIRELQLENSTLKQNQFEMQKTIQKLQQDQMKQSSNHKTPQHSELNNSNSEELERVKIIANHEIHQLRKYIYNVEEQTIEELKSMWMKMDHLEQSITIQQLQQLSNSIDQCSGNGSIVATIQQRFKDEVNNVKSEVRDLYGGFVEVNERMKSIQVDYRDSNARIDDVLKEQRFIRTRHDYEVEHLKRLLEESNSRMRQMGLEITTIRSTNTTSSTTSQQHNHHHYNHHKSSGGHSGGHGPPPTPHYTTTSNMDHRTTSHIATHLPISKYKY